MSGSDTDLTMVKADESLEESNLLTSDVDKSAQAGDGHYAPGELPSQLFAQSHDLLPLVLEQLKDSYTNITNKWKRALAPLLVVNKSFFHCVANMLWETMDSLEPAFKFLPWFRAGYPAIGTYANSGSSGWVRFTLYASRIKHLELESTSNIEISTAWFMELFTLPGRPQPLFSALQTIELSSEVLKGPPVAFLLVGPALRSLYVADGQNQPSPHASSILPTLPISSPNIQVFKYDGKLSREFLSRLSQVISITTLELASTYEGDRRDLRELRVMPRLESLTLSVPSFTTMTRPLSMKTCLPQYAHLPTLKSLEVTATEYQQCLIARAISPRSLHEITLTFIRAQNLFALPLCLALYLDANEFLSRLAVKFANPRNDSFGLTPRPRATDWPASAKAKASFRDALRKSKGIESFFVYDIPFELAPAISTTLLGVLPGWSLLTHLCFRLPGDDLQHTQDSSAHIATPRFPGLSFLASIWDHCPKLEDLEYHFDKELVETECLNESLTVCETRVAGRASGYHPMRHHRLRKLCINTYSILTIQGSKGVELSVSRKIQIATFLDRLFPVLEVVEGSALEVWSEVDAWVKSYQSLRSHIEAQVDTVLADY